MVVAAPATIYVTLPRTPAAFTPYRVLRTLHTRFPVHLPTFVMRLLPVPRSAPLPVLLRATVTTHTLHLLPPPQRASHSLPPHIPTCPAFLLPTPPCLPPPAAHVADFTTHTSTPTCSAVVRWFDIGYVLVALVCGLDACVDHRRRCSGVCVCSARIWRLRYLLLRFLGTGQDRMKILDTFCYHTCRYTCHHLGCAFCVLPTYLPTTPCQFCPAHLPPPVTTYYVVCLRTTLFLPRASHPTTCLTPYYLPYVLLPTTVHYPHLPLHTVFSSFYYCFAAGFLVPWLALLSPRVCAFPAAALPLHRCPHTPTVACPAFSPIYYVTLTCSHCLWDSLLFSSLLSSLLISHLFSSLLSPL